jgi:hypothetical protein
MLLEKPPSQDYRNLKPLSGREICEILMAGIWTNSLT